LSDVSMVLLRISFGLNWEEDTVFKHVSFKDGSPLHYSA
jgi:hypothetical protein